MPCIVELLLTYMLFFPVLLFHIIISTVTFEPFFFMANIRVEPVTENNLITGEDKEEFNAMQ